MSDVAYERTFTQELSPTLLRLVAAMNGVSPPPGDDFEYCELGCGNGDTLVTLAAANPRARFLGVDFLPEHVAFATDLARRGEVTNVQFLDRDFEALSAEEVPRFDFIGAHGVASWVSESKRRALIAFAHATLKPGGLLYVSYNALPGWAVMEPLRRLMLEHTATLAGTTLERAREAVHLLHRLSEAGAGYFANHPTARSMLALMKKAGLAYVAHEYFHAHWHPMYFADVAREMATKDLSYVGQLPLHLNLRELAIPPSTKAVIPPDGDRLEFETLKDFALNEFFRSDVYVKGPIRTSDEARQKTFREAAFGTLASAALVKRDLRLPHYTVQYTGELYDALIPEIAERPASATKLAEQAKLAKFGPARIGDALMNLTLGGQVLPMRPHSTARTSGPYRIALAHNRRVLDLDGRRTNNTPIVLASPVTGTGMTLTMMEAVCLRLLVEPDAQHRERWLRSYLASQPMRLVSGADRTHDPEALVGTIQREFELFRARWSDKLVEVGILEPTTTP